MLKKLLIAGLVLLVLLAVSTASMAAGFYKGKTLTIIIPHSPGQNMDRYARAIGPKLADELGAKIRFQQAQGAGGVRGTNLVWAAKPDGLSMGFSSIPSLVLTQLSDSEGVQYDATKFLIVGRISTEPRVFAVGQASGFKTMQDVVNAKRVIKFPSQGLDEDFFAAAVMAKTLNFQILQITGYEGNADTALAVVRGDGDGHITALSAATAMIRDGDKIPLLMFWRERVKGYENVPTALEVTSGQGRDFMDVMVSLIDLHRCFFMPPGVPADRVQEIRDALAKVMSDSDFVRDMEAGNLLVDFMHGDEAQSRVAIVAKNAAAIRPVLLEAAKAVR